MIFRRQRPEAVIPRQPRPERPPYTPPVQFGSARLDPRFDPCGAPPLNAENLGDRK